MPVESPFVASPLQPHIPSGLLQLVERANGRLTHDDKMAGIDLLLDAYDDLLDHTLLNLMDKMEHQDTRALAEARKTVDDIKSRARHYVRWAGARIANHRLPPVIHHFHSLVQELDLGPGMRHHSVLPISKQVAEHSQIVLDQLCDGTAENLDAGLKLMQDIVHELSFPLAIAPKNLLDFHFMVSKPLDGAIVLIRSLMNRMITRFGREISPDMYPVVGGHLQSFLIIPRR